MGVTVCWYIQSHRNPEQLLRLVRTLRRGSTGPIIVTHDPSGEPIDPTSFVAIPRVHLVPPPVRPVRGSFSGQLDPYLNAIEWLEQGQIGYDWLVNITGQDYPVSSLPDIEAFLDRADCDGFVRQWDVLAADSPWSRRKAKARYWSRYWWLPARMRGPLRALRWIGKVTPVRFYLDYGALVGIRRLSTPFNRTLRCRGGWAFWTLRHIAVLRLRQFLAARPDVERHYRRTVAPEESLVQTILGADPELRLVNDDLRYIDYSGAVGGSPRTLTVADLPRFRDGRYHFARKFDERVDREVLDCIDREIHGLG
jgi:hypothetical protein